MKSFSDFFVKSFYIITSSTVTLAIISPILIQMVLLSSAIADEQRVYPFNPKHGEFEIVWPDVMNGTRRKKELDEEVKEKEKMVFPRHFQLDYLMLIP